jgi:hypothetical protein
MGNQVCYSQALNHTKDIMQKSNHRNAGVTHSRTESHQGPYAT